MEMRTYEIATNDEPESTLHVSFVKIRKTIVGQSRAHYNGQHHHVKMVQEHFQAWSRRDKRASLKNSRDVKQEAQLSVVKAR